MCATSSFVIVAHAGTPTHSGVALRQSTVRVGRTVDNNSVLLVQLFDTLFFARAGRAVIGGLQRGFAPTLTCSLIAFRAVLCR